MPPTAHLGPNVTVKVEEKTTNKSMEIKDKGLLPATSFFAVNQMDVSVKAGTGQSNAIKFLWKIRKFTDLSSTKISAFFLFFNVLWIKLFFFSDNSCDTQLEVTANLQKMVPAKSSLKKCTYIFSSTVSRRIVLHITVVLPSGQHGTFCKRFAFMHILDGSERTLAGNITYISRSPRASIYVYDSYSDCIKFSVYYRSIGEAGVVENGSWSVHVYYLFHAFLSESEKLSVITTPAPTTPSPPTKPYYTAYITEHVNQDSLCGPSVEVKERYCKFNGTILKSTESCTKQHLGYSYKIYVNISNGVKRCEETKLRNYIKSRIQSKLNL